ncbi:MAG: D-2-hydroxyacid dehydrogenase [Actinomycetota bacterium]
MGDTILVSEAFVEANGDRLRAAAPDLGILAIDPTDETGPDADVIADATIAFLSNDVWPDGAAGFFRALTRASELAWLHVMFAGVDHRVFQQLMRRGVSLTTSQGASAPAIAETVVLYLTALSRGLPEHIRRQPSGPWEWHRWRPLAGRRVAVVGYGPVGRRIEQALRWLGMDVTCVRRAVRGDETCPVRTLDELPAVCAESDVVVLALPLTDDTAGILSRPIIEALAADCLVVNVGRGALVDQPALTEALRDGRLAGAGLDVFETEPLDPEDPLWVLPNVIITPHNAGASTDAPERVTDLFFENLRRWLAGDELLNRATPAAAD